MTNPIDAWDGTSLKDHEARRARVSLLEEIANGWRKNVEAAQRLAAEPPPETRECEGCGQQKPIEEMHTCFLPGTGETYQCNACRGLPTGGSSGCAAGTECEP